MRTKKVTSTLFKSRVLTFNIMELCHELRVELQMPDLRYNKVLEWGDWGPNYEVALRPNQKFRLLIDDKSTGVTVERFFRPSCLTVESPMLAQEREQHPLVCRLSDPGSGLGFVLYFSLAGELLGSDIIRKQATWLPAWSPQMQLSA